MALFLQDLINGISAGALYAVAAVGFSFVFATTKVFNAAYGAVYLVGAYIFIEIHNLIPGFLGIIVSVIAGIAAASAFSVLSSIVVYDHMIKRGRSFFAVFVTSFGVLILVENALAIPFGTGTQLLGGSLLNGFDIGSVQITRADILSVCASAAILAALSLFFFRSNMGIQLRSMADNDGLVSDIGLPAKRYRWLAFGIGGIVVAPAAILTAYVQGVAPSDGLDVLTIAMAATIVGGVGSLAGAGISGLVFGIAENLSAWKLPGAWEETVAFGLFFAIIMVRPQGFVNRGWH